MLDAATNQAASDPGRSESREGRARWRPYTATSLAASFLLWTAIGLIEATPQYVQARVRGEEEASLLGYLINVLPRWYLWALLTPAVVWLARRFPVHRGFWRPFLTVHLPASLAVTLVHVAAWLLIRSYVLDPGGRSFLQLAQTFLIAFFPLDLLAFWAILGGYFTFSHLSMARDRELESARLELRASRLEGLLANARLAALSAQLQPHFLFNTLNAISEYVHVDPQRAEAMIVALGDMLRLVVDRAGRPQVRLQEELEIVDVYLSIERARMGERLRATTRAEPAALDGLVPVLSIQPLVENAVRHGLADVEGIATLDVVAAMSDGRLHIEVRDNGTGLQAGAGPHVDPSPHADPVPRREGVGLGNTRSRLRELYGPDFRLELRADPRGGTVATLEVPFRTDEVDPTAGGAE